MNFATGILLTVFLAALGPRAAGPRPVVVVELFTSQGCSSCPAADELLNEIIKNPGRTVDVLGLSFHVSYWNNLGWKDPYSDEAFTERQKKYANVLHLQSIYTPQMIVNGRDEFVGSDRKSLAVAIERGAREIPACRIGATASFSAKSVTVAYRVDSKPANALLNVALVAPLVRNDVLRGENKGKKLTHANVVVALKTIDLADAGDVVLDLPASSSHPQELFVILFVQEASSLKIVSAIELPRGQ